MQVFVNDKLEEVEEGSSLISLLEKKGLAVGKGLAVAINEQVIAKEKWKSCTLKHLDKIMLIGVFYGG